MPTCLAFLGYSKSLFCLVSLATNLTLIKSGLKSGLHMISVEKLNQFFSWSLWSICDPILMGKGIDDDNVLSIYHD